MGSYLWEGTFKLKNERNWLCETLKWDIILKAEKTACAKALGQEELGILQDKIETTGPKLSTGGRQDWQGIEKQADPSSSGH